jgi:hypothetical protein
MSRYRFYLIFTLLPFSFFLLLSGCEKTMEEEVIKPIEMMVGQKSAAAAQAAIANVRTVRAALMRYPATSPTNQYPGDVDIYDYRTLREVLADENLPPDMAELMWDAGFGITYRSDGYTFTFEVRAISADGEIMTATPGGITKSK